MARAAARLLALAPLLCGGAPPAAAPAAAPPAISASSSKQIVAVLDTLSDIVSSVQGEQAKEAKLFTEFQQWCRKEKGSLASALDEAQSQSESSDVGSKELNATVVQLETRLAEIQKAIDETHDIMAKADTIRDKENDQSNDDLTLNRQSLDQVESAIKIVEKVHRPGLLQNSALRRYQLSEPGESSYVLGIMKGLKEKLEKTRRTLQEEESGKLEMHNKFMSTKKGEMSSLKDEKVEKKNTLTESRISLVELKHILEQSQKKVQEVTKIAKETSDLCHAKEESYKVRSTEREQELAALKEAVAAIRTGAEVAAKPAQAVAEDAALVQVARHRHALRRSSGGGDVGQGKSQAVVQKLISVLEKEQAEEQEKVNYCKAELKTKTKEREDVEDKLAQLKASIDFKSGEVETIENEVETMQETIETMKANLEEAAALRKREKAGFEATTKDRKLAIKVLKQAEQVLKSFYASQDKTALVQGKAARAAKPPPTWSDKSTRKTIRSATAVELMDKVAGEIGQEQKQAAEDESKAAAAYEKLTAESRAEFDRVMEEITQRVKRKAKLVVQLNTHKEEQTQSKADLEAVESQLQSFHKECDELLENFEKRTKARSWESSQLKDVIDILAGSSVAVRTGLVQAASSGERQGDEASGLDESASALLRDMASA